MQSVDHLIALSLACGCMKKSEIGRKKLPGCGHIMALKLTNNKIFTFILYVRYAEKHTQRPNFK